MLGNQEDEPDIVLKAGERLTLDYMWVDKLISPFKDADDLPPIKLEDADGGVPKRILPGKAKELAEFIFSHTDQIVERVNLRSAYIEGKAQEKAAREATREFAKTAAKWLIDVAKSSEIIHVAEVPAGNIDITWQIGN